MKALMRIAGSESVKRILRQPLFAYLIGFVLALRIRTLRRGDGTLRILAFSSFRFAQDLETLADNSSVDILTIPPMDVHRINAIFNDRTRPLPPVYDIAGKASDRYYYVDVDDRLAELRAGLADYIARIAGVLKKLRAVDCAITPAIHYASEQEWAAGFDQGGIPFVALHKEFTLIDQKHIAARSDLYRRTNHRFQGTAIGVNNFTGKQLFEEANIAPGRTIQVNGLMRMDRLLAADSPYRSRPNDGKVVTLFSFGHYSGGLDPTEMRSHYFSAHDHEGFVQLFEDAHRLIAQMAVKRPDVTFYMKPKVIEDWWTCEIEKQVELATGKTLAEIPNLSIVETRAPELIRDSSVVIGFNSTVLLEAVLLNRNVIMPYYAEATGRHKDHVYYTEYLDLMNAATSRQDLEAKIDAGLNDDQALVCTDGARRKAFVRQYIGYEDGRSCERVVAFLKAVIQDYTTPPYNATSNRSGGLKTESQ